jgi:DNA polymerase-3 subunit delta
VADYNLIIKGLKQGKYSPVYFLQGEESFFIDNIVSFIEANALDEAQKSFNQYGLYGKDIAMTDILNAARKYPMMGGRQVVIVKEAQSLSDWKKEAAIKLLTSYIENPLSSTILVFAYKDKAIDKRTKIAKALEKHTIFMLSKKIYDNQIPDWVRSFAVSAEAQLTDRAVMILAESIGNNLQRLANEIEKLKLNVPTGTAIDDRAVQKYVGISKDYNDFELQKALAMKNKAKALAIINYFGANPSGNPVIRIIANLSNYFNKLLIINHQRLSDKNDIARAIGGSPFFAGEYLQAARQYPLPIIIRNISYIHQADLQSKGIKYASIPPAALLKELIFKLLQ